MDLKAYFEKTQGTGVLSTADKQGRVDAALYARPHVTEEGQVAFIMADKLSHSNLSKNPRACYLFREAKGNKGKRLYLRKSRETTDQAVIASLRRRSPAHHLQEGDAKFLVYFDVEKELPLVGDGQSERSVCPTCHKPAGEEGHMCAPWKAKGKSCDWCGAMVLSPRHLCVDKLKELTYVCNSCGRTAVKAEGLCAPAKVKGSR